MGLSPVNVIKSVKNFNYTTGQALLANVREGNLARTLLLRYRESGLVHGQGAAI